MRGGAIVPSSGALGLPQSAAAAGARGGFGSGAEAQRRKNPERVMGGDETMGISWSKNGESHGIPKSPGVSILQYTTIAIHDLIWMILANYPI